jgi:hypothetical protein
MVNKGKSKKNIIGGKNTRNFFETTESNLRLIKGRESPDRFLKTGEMIGIGI